MLWKEFSRIFNKACIVPFLSRVLLRAGNVSWVWSMAATAIEWALSRKSPVSAHTVNRKWLFANIVTALTLPCITLLIYTDLLSCHTYLINLLFSVNNKKNTIYCNIFYIWSYDNNKSNNSAPLSFLTCCTILPNSFGAKGPHLRQ